RRNGAADFFKPEQNHHLNAHFKCRAGKQSAPAVPPAHKKTLRRGFLLFQRRLSAVAENPQQHQEQVDEIKIQR
ncbi:hypothetical protein ACSTIS_23760, partial [Vibrio parahaemolyticus]